MNKVIRRLRPRDYWRIGEHESWFTDMAAEGYHLKKMGLKFAKFVKGEPKKMKYRIDVTINKKISPDQKQMYAESGWDYVTNYGYFNVFSSPNEMNAPELHTDLMEQSFTLKELDKKLAWNSFIVVVLMFLSIGMLSATMFHKSAVHTLSLIEGHFIQISTLIIFDFYLIYTSLKAAISIHTLRKKLLVGNPIDHNAPWKKYQRLNYLILSILIVFIAFGTLLPWIRIIMEKTENLPVNSTNLPIVRLADIEQNSELIPQHDYYRDNIDMLNRYTYYWSLLAPIQYESNEKGTVPNKMWKDGSGTYSPSISTWVYKLSFSSMSESAVYDLIERYGREYESRDFIEVEHSDFDKLIIHEGDYSKKIFACKGKGVIYIRYFGYTNIDLIIKATSEKINLISD